MIDTILIVAGFTICFILLLKVFLHNCKEQDKGTSVSYSAGSNYCDGDGGTEGYPSNGGLG